MPRFRRVTRFRPLVAEVARAGTRLTGLALVAVGVSGLLAWGMGALAGKAFVAGDPPGVTYTAARCADFLEYAPHATSCEDAATHHHFGEIVGYRLVAGVAGGVLLAATAWRRRRHRRAPAGELLPHTFVPTVAAAATATTGAWLTGQGVDRAVLGTGAGGGGDLSAGVVAVALALWFARPVVAAITARLPPPEAPA